MVARRTLLLLLTFFLLVNARQRAVQHPAGKPFSDTFSYSEPHKVTTRHLALDLTIEPAMGRLRGTATLDIENLSGTRTLILDSYELQVSQVRRDGTPAAWSLGQKSDFGQPLIIEIEPETRFVSIDYVTGSLPNGLPDAFGGTPLFWRVPEGTLAGKEPFAYSLNEPIGARTWLPVQDTPVVRMTYEATLRVPPGLMALMSAEGNPTAVNGTGVYDFRMPHPIPSYLIAFAVGRLGFHAFDDRTGVYAEPELLAEAVWELQSMPEMMDVAEEIAGPFPFARHDVLIMPPGFPVGGMEHPMLNFLSATSTVVGTHVANPPPKRLVAHELAHSWAGDSTTLASWNDVWLNEGFATYLAHRILEEMQDPELTELAWANDRIGIESFLDLLPSSHLHRPVTYPSEGFDSASYTKGALFVRTLEDHLGRARFDDFLKSYFESMRWRSIGSATFLSVFKELVQPDAALLAELRLEEWVYRPGLPSNVTAPSTSAISRRVQPRINAFNAGTPIAQLSPGTWSETEIEMFLLSTRTRTRARMAEVDAALSLSSRQTPPRTWLLDVIMMQYEPGMAAVERVLMRGAPLAWLQQLYDQLKRWDLNRGRQIFQRARGGYFPYYNRQIAFLLGVPLSSNAWKLRNAA